MRRPLVSRVWEIHKHGLKGGLRKRDRVAVTAPEAHHTRASLGPQLKTALYGQTPKDAFHTGQAVTT